MGANPRAKPQAGKREPKSTTVSIEADTDYIQLLRVYAAIHRTTVAKMTRDALDQVYGEALRRVPQPE